ncbi:S24 family peptidase [Maridesulfovibrio sp.]|uniref:S24 family peptidase n=1 Tax=Maridesulfovibrio sp. TaxID=2795000 RepID=UPI002A1891F5|nr:S24 family peptidase [Maridesulfovibrio sp.]
MSFYTDMVEGLKSMIGPGKKYTNPTQMAKACGVAPNQIIRYIRQERGKHIQVVAKVLDEVGARIVFPGGTPECPNTGFTTVQEGITRPDESGESLTPSGSESRIAFAADRLADMGSADDMIFVNVTGDAMSPRIEDGDGIIVDQSQRELYEGRIYAFRIDREIVIRRVAKEPGKIILVSDNRDSEPRTISLQIGDEFRGWAALGRVVFVAKDLA